MLRPLLLFLGLGALAAAEENRIQNSQFADELADWVPFGSQQAFTATPQGLRFATDPAGSNIHLDQTPAIQPGTIYRATVEVRAEGRELQPTLRIAGLDWSTVAMAIAPGDGEWHTLELRFYSGEHTQVRYQLFGAGRGRQGDQAEGVAWFRNPLLQAGTDEDLAAFQSARIAVDPTTPGHTVNPLFFGVNSLFWIDDDAARADGKIAAQLKDMGCTLARFPGGEVADNYHWQTNLLDNNADFPYEDGPEKMDFDEFIAWIRTFGAEPIIVVNLESSYLAGNPEEGVREAAAWVRYANVTQGYGVKYWEIGNETDLLGTRYPLTAEEYAEAVVRFSRAMKAEDPSIQVGALGPSSPAHAAHLDRLTPERRTDFRALPRGERRARRDQFPPEQPGEPWWPTVSRIAGGHFDFAIVHRYDNSRREFTTASVAPLNLAEPSRALDRYFRDQFGRKIPLALTEWNVWRQAAGLGPVGHALTIAEQVGNYLEGGIEMANYWPMRYPRGNRDDFFRALLDYETKEPQPAFEVLKLFRHHAVGQIVPAVADNPQLYAFATRDGDKASLFLVNRLGFGDGIAARIDIPGIPTGQARCLIGANEDGKMTFIDLEVARDGSVWTCLLPPHSLVVIPFELE